MNLEWKVTLIFLDPLDLGLDDDDQHDYDSVASDEDTDSELTTQNNNTQRSNRAKVNRYLFLRASTRPGATLFFFLLHIILASKGHHKHI